MRWNGASDLSSAGGKAAYIRAMTDPSTPPVPNDVESAIRDRLVATLTPERLEVVNDSAHRHAGHAGDDGSGQTHWIVRVESSAFAGLSPPSRSIANGW